MSPRLLLLACLAVGACLAAGLASAQPQDEDGGSCGLWGIATPGEDERGVRLGARLGEIKPAGGWPSDEVRLYDKLEHQLLRFDTAAGGLPGGLIVQTIRCDGGEPLVVGSGIGGAKEYDIGLEGWRAREGRALARETGTLVGTAQRANLVYLWSIKQIRPVSESAATDYLIVERWCLLDKPAAAGGSRCSLVGWSTVTVRSLVNPLPING